MNPYESYMEVVTFPLEFGRRVNFVCHDPGDGLFNIFHPFNHLGLTHDVHVLDERIIFLPERHLECLCCCPVCVCEEKSIKFHVI